MAAVLITLGIIFALAMLISVSHIIGILSFFSMIYFFAEGNAVYGIYSLIVFFIMVAISNDSETITIRRW